MKKQKKRMTRQEEFEIVKMVLDKFLWAGTAIMGIGFYKLFTDTELSTGISWMVAGALLLVVFIVMVVREYEIIT